METRIKLSDFYSLLTRNEASGSQLRCLFLTQDENLYPIQLVLNRLTKHTCMFNPTGDHIYPRGIKNKQKQSLTSSSYFISDRSKRDELLKWWGSIKKYAKLPQWDIVSTCAIGGQKGLLLVKASASRGELISQGRCFKKRDSSYVKVNFLRMNDAFSEVNSYLGKGWNLSSDAPAELCSSFAWSWKIASMGIPVVLLFLGFIDAEEMEAPFYSDSDYTEYIMDISKNIIPKEAWDSKIYVDGTSYRPIINSMKLDIDVMGTIPKIWHGGTMNLHFPRKGKT